MAATKTVQISTLGEKSFPIFSARVTDQPAADVDAILKKLTDLNPTITGEQCLQAIWDEGVTAVKKKLGLKRLPGRLSSLKIVTPPQVKLGPRPTE